MIKYMKVDMDQFKPFNDQKEYEQNVKPHEVKYVEEV
jgi:hypothetical protein